MNEKEFELNKVAASDQREREYVTVTWIKELYYTIKSLYTIRMGKLMTYY